MASLPTPQESGEEPCEPRGSNCLHKRDSIHVWLNPGGGLGVTMGPGCCCWHHVPHLRAP